MFSLIALASMPKAKTNKGPCCVHNCNKESNEFRRLTDNAMAKASAAETLKQYQYLQPGQQICHSHYMTIVESIHSSCKHKQMLNVNDELCEDNVTIGKLDNIWLI